MMNGGPISWKSRRHDSVTLSTSETEYMESSLCGQEYFFDIHIILRDLACHHLNLLQCTRIIFRVSLVFWKFLSSSELRVENKCIHPKFNEDQHGCYTPWFRGGVSDRSLRLEFREVCTSKILGKLVRLVNIVDITVWGDDVDRFGLLTGGGPEEEDSPSFLDHLFAFCFIVLKLCHYFKLSWALGVIVTSVSLSHHTFSAPEHDACQLTRVKSVPQRQWNEVRDGRWLTAKLHQQ